MLTLQISQIFLAFGHLLNFASAVLEPTEQIRTIDRVTGSFHCGQKLFLSSFVRNLVSIAIKEPRNFIDATGKLNINHDGSVVMWPLPMVVGHPLDHGIQIVYHLVLDRNNHEVLGMVYKLSRKNFVHCTEGNAAGEINSVTAPSGSFVCQSHVIPNYVIMNYAKEVRDILIDLKSTALIGFPIPYAGNAALSGSGPYNIFPMRKSGEYSAKGGFHIIFDKNLDVVGALALIKHRTENVLCRLNQFSIVEPMIVIPPVQVGPEEYDAFRCGSKSIKASKVLRDAREALAGFERQNAGRIVEYPKPYHGELHVRFRKDLGNLFLWPLRIGREITKTARPSPKEPFMAVLTDSLKIVGVVAEQVGGKYMHCHRFAAKKF